MASWMAVGGWIRRHLTSLTARVLHNCQGDLFRNMGANGNDLINDPGRKKAFRISQFLTLHYLACLGTWDR